MLQNYTLPVPKSYAPYYYQFRARPGDETLQMVQPDSMDDDSSSEASVLFKLRTPLVPDPGQTRGVLMKVPDPQNFPPSGGKSSAKKLIFGRFSTFQVPKIFRPSAEKFSGQTRGGFLMKGGFLNLNTPDA